MGLVERREEILKLLISRRKSTVPILMHEFHVSEKTIRRDIRALMLKYPLETFSGNGGGVQIKSAVKRRSYSSGRTAAKGGCIPKPNTKANSF